MASTVNIGFPYRKGDVCFFELVRRGKTFQEPVQLQIDRQKRDAFDRALAGKSNIYAVWPGIWTSDLFLIDDLDAAVEALGFKVDA